MRTASVGADGSWITVFTEFPYTVTATTTSAPLVAIATTTTTTTTNTCTTSTKVRCSVIQSQAQRRSSPFIGTNPSTTLRRPTEMARLERLKSKGVGFLGRGCSPYHQLGAWGSAVSSRSRGVRGEAPATWQFRTFFYRLTSHSWCRFCRYYVYLLCFR